MIKDRQRRFPKEYWIEDKYIYLRAINTIRSYESIKAKYLDAIDMASASGDGQPRGSGISDPTAQRTMKAIKFKEELDAIEECIEYVPIIYQNAIWEHCIKGKPFPDERRKTYGKYKQIYIFRVAERLGLI